MQQLIRYESPDKLCKECIEIIEEQMHGLKVEETADARENTFSRWPGNFPSAVHVSQWRATSWDGGEGGGGEDC